MKTTSLDKTLIGWIALDNRLVKFESYSLAKRIFLLFWAVQLSVSILRICRIFQSVNTDYFERQEAEA